jgi:hypothetical protein
MAAATTTSTITTTTTYDCPIGWVDDGDIGCFLFAADMAGVPWLEALEYCEVMVGRYSMSPSLCLTSHPKGGFLAEPKTEEQLQFLASLGYVEETLTGVQGWWVGLSDLGHEGEWVWQVGRE